MKATAPVHNNTSSSQSLMMLGALGVVFGDIGTSPLYAFQDCFSHGLVPSRPFILGIISLIFWGLSIVVALKYVYIVMQASNKGEGGILALAALASGGTRKLSKNTSLIAIIGFFGAALFFGDSIITPAISVLSAVEGLNVVAPHLYHFVIPIACTLLIGLFLFQHVGTERVGHWFGPIMVVWFISIGSLGLIAIIKNPSILQALNPMHAIKFIFSGDLTRSFGVLGSVILAFTGAEALYADMGHFGAKTIRRSWFALVFPAIILNYFGQGATLIDHPEIVGNPFFGLVPEMLHIPFIFLAAAATVIASQSVISGAFSIAQQAIQLGYLPRMVVQHTSAKTFGQVYVPRMNAIMCGCVLLLVILFRTSTALAGAYGLAVMGTMVATTLLVISVAHHIWNWSLKKIALILVPFLLIDLLFFSTALSKFTSGGWLPVVIGGAFFTVFLTWHHGREIIMSRRTGHAKKIDTFIEKLDTKAYARVSGTAIYLSSLRSTIPQAMHNNLVHNKVLHEKIIILHVHYEKEPRVADDQRLEVKSHDQGFWQVTLHYGFIERPNVWEDLKNHLLLDEPMDPANTSFFVGHDLFVASDAPLRPQWREKLFLFMANNASATSEYFRIPPDRVVEIGIQIEV